MFRYRLASRFSAACSRPSNVHGSGTTHVRTRASRSGHFASASITSLRRRWSSTATAATSAACVPISSACSTTARSRTSRWTSSFMPISLVICLQANSHVQGMLPQVKKIGNLIQPLLIGEQGEAAVIAYDQPHPHAAGLHLRRGQDHQGDVEDLRRAAFEPDDRRGRGSHADAAHAPEEPAAHHPA